ncbi:GNAT family N-acetyltransferase [Calditrichota bacterium LG25]
MTREDLKRIKDEFGMHGVFHALEYSLINKISFYKELQGMIVTMQTLNPKYLRGNPNYEHRFLNADEVKKYAADPETQLTEKFLERAFKKGDRCFAILDGDFLASYGWYSTQPTPINQHLVLYFDPQWVYMYKGYTHPRYRGQRLHAVGMAKALKAVTGEGFKGLISYVETNNFASLRSVYRMGYINIGKVKIFRIMGKYKIQSDKECAQYHFTVRPITNEQRG